MFPPRDLWALGAHPRSCSRCPREPAAARRKPHPRRFRRHGPRTPLRCSPPSSSSGVRLVERPSGARWSPPPVPRRVRFAGTLGRATAYQAEAERDLARVAPHSPADIVHPCWGALRPAPGTPLAPGDGWLLTGAPATCAPSLPGRRARHSARSPEGAPLLAGPPADATHDTAGMCPRTDGRTPASWTPLALSKEPCASGPHREPPSPPPTWGGIGRGVDEQPGSLARQDRTGSRLPLPLRGEG
jgi:hypothetical protein